MHFHRSPLKTNKTTEKASEGLIATEASFEETVAPAAEEMPHVVGEIVEPSTTPSVKRIRLSLGRAAKDAKKGEIIRESQVNVPVTVAAERKGKSKSAPAAASSSTSASQEVSAPEASSSSQSELMKAEVARLLTLLLDEVGKTAQGKHLYVNEIETLRAKIQAKKINGFKDF